jgi:hypothetical protein
MSDQVAFLIIIGVTVPVWFLLLVALKYYDLDAKRQARYYRQKVQ